jgi:hypothetical protein
MTYKHHLIHNFCSVDPIATNLLSMDSSEHVEHSGIKKIQTWNVHTLATVKFNQITNLTTIWILKKILEWNHLQ